MIVVLTYFDLTLIAVFLQFCITLSANYREKHFFNIICILIKKSYILFMYRIKKLIKHIY